MTTWLTDGFHAPHAFEDGPRDDDIGRRSLCERAWSADLRCATRREVELHGCSRCWRAASAVQDHGMQAEGK